MTVIAVFALFVFVGDAIVVGICSFIEQFSKSGSLFAFLGLFMVVFVIAWLCAVRVTERFLVRS